MCQQRGECRAEGRKRRDRGSDAVSVVRCLGAERHATLREFSEDPCALISKQDVFGECASRVRSVHGSKVGPEKAVEGEVGIGLEIGTKGCKSNFTCDREGHETSC